MLNTSFFAYASITVQMSGSVAPTASMSSTSLSPKQRNDLIPCWSLNFSNQPCENAISGTSGWSSCRKCAAFARSMSLFKLTLSCCSRNHHLSVSSICEYYTAWRVRSASRRDETLVCAAIASNSSLCFRVRLMVACVTHTPCVVHSHSFSSPCMRARRQGFCWHRVMCIPSMRCPGVLLYLPMVW